MRIIWGLLVSCLVSISAHAQTAYLDMEYSSAIIRPDEQGFLASLVATESNQIAMVVTVLMDKGENSYTIVKPAKHVATFKINKNNLEELNGRSIPLVKRLPVYGHQDILLKIEFFSSTEKQLTSLTNGIKSLGELYTSASSPQLSPLVTSVMDGFLQLIAAENNIYVNTTIKVNSEKSGGYAFYVDSKGMQTDKRVDATAILNFDVVSNTNYSVNWGAHWSNQPTRPDSENRLFQQLKDAEGHRAKNKFCQALRAEISKRLPHSATEDLLAIAINSVRWPQDDTIPNRCMELEQAVNYKAKRNQKFLVACNSEECLNSKQALNRWLGGSSTRIINKALGSDISTTSNCYDEILALNGWNSPTYSPKEGVFSVKTSVEKKDGAKVEYKQDFLWENGVLVEHSCN